MGSYDNQVTVDIPPHMSTYKEARLSEGLSDVVSIDRCILETVQYLWSLGIRTIGSCCGHGDQKLAYVAVVDADVPVMESLGLRTIPSEDAYVFHIRGIPENVWKRLARKLYRELSVCPSCDGGGYTETRIRDSRGADIDCDIAECRHCMGYGDSHTAAVKRQSNKLRAERDQLAAQVHELKVTEDLLIRKHYESSEQAEAWKLAFDAKKAQAAELDDYPCDAEGCPDRPETMAKRGKALLAAVTKAIEAEEAARALEQAGDHTETLLDRAVALVGELLQNAYTSDNSDNIEDLETIISVLVPMQLEQAGAQKSAECATINESLTVAATEFAAKGERIHPAIRAGCTVPGDVEKSELFAVESGKHLGAVRNWIKWHCRNGDRVTWGSDQVLGLTVRDLEEIAQKVADAVKEGEDHE